MRPQTPVPLTLDEHRELGVEMRATNARLQELCKLIVSVYGPNTPAAFAFMKVSEGMQRLCQDLQAQAHRDLPGFPVEDLYVAPSAGATNPPASPHSADPATFVRARNSRE